MSSYSHNDDDSLATPRAPSPSGVTAAVASETNAGASHASDAYYTQRDGSVFGRVKRGTTASAAGWERVVDLNTGEVSYKAKGRACHSFLWNMIALLSIIAHAMVVVFSIIEYVFLEIVDVKLIIVVSSGVLAGFFALTVILAPFALIPSLNKSTAPLMLKTFLVSLVIFINWAMFMVCIIHWRSHYQVNSPMECLMDTSPPLDILQPNSTTNIVSMSSSTMTGTNGMGSGNKQLPLNMMHTQCYSQFMAIFLLQATIGSAVQMFIVAMYTSSCVTRRMDYAPVKYSMYPKEQYQFMNNSDLSNNMEMTEIGRMGNSGTSKQQ